MWVIGCWWSRVRCVSAGVNVAVPLHILATAYICVSRCGVFIMFFLYFIYIHMYVCVFVCLDEWIWTLISIIHLEWRSQAHNNISLVNKSILTFLAYFYSDFFVIFFSGLRTFVTISCKCIEIFYWFFYLQSQYFLCFFCCFCIRLSLYFYFSNFFLPYIIIYEHIYIQSTVSLTTWERRRSVGNVCKRENLKVYWFLISLIS